MTRIPELKAETMSDAQKKVVNLITSGPHQQVMGPYPAWLQSPELAKRTRSLSEYLRFQSKPSKRLAEIAILITGRVLRACATGPQGGR
jgi:4-carboxymuconolactone decarboxylase